MKPRRHDMLDFHPAAVVGSLLGGDPYAEASPVDAEPDTTTPEPRALGRLAARLRRRRGARRLLGPRPERPPPVVDA
jgi:hypothetical protein